MAPHKSRPPITRRDALCRIGNGFGMLAFASLVGESIARAAGPDVFGQDGGLDARKLDHPARAKHVIFLFMNGGLSQVDSFDPKPMLDKFHGQPLPGGEVATERKTGTLLRSPPTTCTVASHTCSAGARLDGCTMWLGPSPNTALYRFSPSTA